MQLREDKRVFCVHFLKQSKGKKKDILVPVDRDDTETSVFHTADLPLEFQLSHDNDHYGFQCESEDLLQQWLEQLNLQVNEYDVFLSYHKTNLTQDIVMNLSYMLRGWGYRTCHTKRSLKENKKNVTISKAYLLYLSPGVFARRDVMQECYTAIKYGKPILTIYDEINGGFSFQGEQQDGAYKNFLDFVNADVSWESHYHFQTL